jgi:hypothetical protein
MSVDLSKLSTQQLLVLGAAITAAASVVSAVVAGVASFVLATVNARSAERLERWRSRRGYRLRQLEKAHVAIDARFECLSHAFLTGDVSDLNADLLKHRLSIPNALRDISVTSSLANLAYFENKLLDVLPNYHGVVTKRELWEMVRDVWVLLEEVQRLVEQMIFAPPLWSRYSRWKYHRYLKALLPRTLLQHEEVYLDKGSVDSREMAKAIHDSVDKSGLLK